LVFKPQAVEDLAWWIKHDRKTALKIIKLLRRDYDWDRIAEGTMETYIRNPTLPLMF